MFPIRFRTLSQIFTLAAILISVPLLVGTVLSFFYIERLSNNNRDLVVRGLEIGRESEKLIDNIEELNRTAQQYVVVRDKDVYNLYTQKQIRLIDTLDWLELLVEKQEAKQVLKQIRHVSNVAFERIQHLSKSPEQEDIDTGIFERLSELSEDLSFFSDAAIKNQLGGVSRRVEAARRVLYLIWSISAALIAAFIAVFALFIAKPIRRMDFHIRRLGRGYFDEPIRIQGPTDIAELGERLDWLRGRLVEVDQIKERFFREMSHQLKTPLASIREGTDLLMDQSGGGIDERRRTEVVELLHDNSMELQRTLDNMLNFSAWRADPGHLYRERFRIRPLVDNIVQHFKTQLMAHHTEVRVDCPEDQEVEMDRDKCRVVIDNLVSNAVKFSPENGVIFVRVSREQSSLIIEVDDQGPGVRPEDRNRIFELFYLGDGPKSGGARGSGIGLALVKAYAQAHGGNVCVESSKDGGARFRVTIPC